MCASFQEKRKTLTFSTQICLKLNFGVRISKIKVRIRNLHFQGTMCVNFQLKRTTLTCFAQIFPKRELGFDIHKTNVGIRISICETPSVPIFRQNGQLWIFVSNLPKNGFWGQNFKNLSLDSKSAPPVNHVCQFSVKMNNLGKWPNYDQYFVSKIVEGVAESWVEDEMSWVEVGGAGWKWMKLGGGGWKWMEVGARFSNTGKKKLVRPASHVGCTKKQLIRNKL